MLSSNPKKADDGAGSVMLVKQRMGTALLLKLLTMAKNKKGNAKVRVMQSEYLHNLCIGFYPHQTLPSFKPLENLN